MERQRARVDKGHGLQEPRLAQSEKRSRNLTVCARACKDHMLKSNTTRSAWLESSEP